MGATSEPMPIFASSPPKEKGAAVPCGTKSVISSGRVSLFGPFDSTAVAWPRLNRREETAPKNAHESPERHQKTRHLASPIDRPSVSEENASNTPEWDQKALKLWLVGHSCWPPSAGRQCLCICAMHSRRSSPTAMHSGRFCQTAWSLAQRLDRRNPVCNRF